MACELSTVATVALAMLRGSPSSTPASSSTASARRCSSSPASGWIRGTCFHQGLSRTFGLAIGTWAIIVGVAVLLLWIPLRQKPGIGTLSNVVLVG